ncbi:hypothetical protein LRC537489_40410 [Mycobacterium riyadhense]
MGHALNDMRVKGRFGDKRRYLRPAERLASARQRWRGCPTSVNNHRNQATECERLSARPPMHPR